MSNGFGRHEEIVGLVVTLDLVVTGYRKIIFTEKIVTFPTFLYAGHPANKTFNPDAGYRVALIAPVFPKNILEIAE